MTENNIEKTEDEILEEMLAQEAQENNESQTDVEEQAPVVDEPVAEPVADVETPDFKPGWQDEAVREVTETKVCMHLGFVQAVMDVPNHDIGHRWSCVCGQLFEIQLNASGKKTLMEVM